MSQHLRWPLTFSNSCSYTHILYEVKGEDGFLLATKYPILKHISFLAAIVPANAQAINCQSDGRLDINEECDDNNTIANDGCTQCTLDPIQLDFNSSDSAGVQYSIEFFELDKVVFFADPSILRFNVTPLDLVSNYRIYTGLLLIWPPFSHISVVDLHF